MLLKTSPEINVDAIKINFDTESLWILNIAIGVIMFGVALGITLDDFKRLINAVLLLYAYFHSIYIYVTIKSFLYNSY